jgi:hypothetical protein
VIWGTNRAGFSLTLRSEILFPEPTWHGGAPTQQMFDDSAVSEAGLLQNQGPTAIAFTVVAPKLITMMGHALDQITPSR